MNYSRGLLRKILGGLCLLTVVSAWGDEGLISALGDEDFQKREEATAKIVVTALVQKDEMIRGLLQAEESEDPEVSWRATTTLERVFLRLEKGYGAPQTGMTIKSKIVTLNLKIGTRPMVGEVKEGSAAEVGGLEKGDLILTVNGVAFEGEDGTAQLMGILNDQNEGAELVIKYSRRGDEGRSEGDATLVLGKPQPMPRDLSSHRQEFNNWKKRQRQAVKEE